MAVPFTVTKKNIPSKPNPIIAYCPRVTSSGVLDLEDLSERVSVSCSATQSDCYAVIIGLVKEISSALEQGNIVRLGHLGSFQISVQSTASATPEEVDKTKFYYFPSWQKIKTNAETIGFQKNSQNVKNLLHYFNHHTQILILPTGRDLSATYCK
jgi:predicted histone-like DNA-binding protein